jgi:probable DNA repair protein
VLEAGRALIVPDTHRAAALRLAWARHQRVADRTVWPSPQVFTWDAWLTRQWRDAVLRGAAPPLQLLSASQERGLWENALRSIAGDDATLAAHAYGLIRAAHQAAQSLLVLSRSAMSDEEQLLLRALTEVRRRCASEGLISLRLAAPESLLFLRDVPPPQIVGEPRLTALQQALQRQCWNDLELLLPDPAANTAAPSLRRFQDLDAELAGCAAWCLAHLRADSAARLLVVSTAADPSPAIQAEMLWQQMAGGGLGSSEQRSRLLAVEGGVPLPHLRLIDDALLALGCLAPEIDTEDVFALLRSPYLRFGSQSGLWSLQGRLERWALARWSNDALREALASVADDEPAAAGLLTWLEVIRERAGTGGRCSMTEWARCFSDVLAAAGFNRGQSLDSREQQRLERWTQLLDEFAGLDAVLAPLAAADALERLRQLAAEGRHQIATGDAAITFSSSLVDPVVAYDGIWVLGLAESRWPAPPRPDPYVAPQEQRANHWPEAGVTERRARAHWTLACWQRRGRELVLSYPEMEGDLRHRPTALPRLQAADWINSDLPVVEPMTGLAAGADDQQFPPISAESAAKPLPGGAERLRLQQDCPFRAQAQWRLKAFSPDPLSDGLTAPLRGTLLHLFLQGLWEELQDQAQLLALTPQAERVLLERHWSKVVNSGVIAGSRWWAPGLAARERARTLDVAGEVLRLERARAPFSVAARESRLQWPDSGARLTLRIDRVDRTPSGARVLIDYKSGAAGRMKLHEGELDPLQLALYVAALAARGEPVAAAVLFSLKPGEVGLAGIAATDGVELPSIRHVDDWDALTAAWPRQLLQLITNHLAGEGTLAHDRNVCRHCHLPALCRRAAEEDLELSDE